MRQKKINKKEIEKINNDILNTPLLTEDFNAEFTSNEPLRDLFSGKNIKFKTELNEEQRASISILFDTYKEFLLKYNINLTALKGVLDEYVDFGASVGRKSRSEFTTAHQAIAQAQAIANAQTHGQAENLKS